MKMIDPPLRWPLSFEVQRSFVVLAILMCTGFAAALEQSPGERYRETLFNIQTHIESKDLEGGRALILGAEKRYPSDGGLENLLGVIDVQQGYREQAIQDFSKAVQHDPKLTSAYLNLGRIYAEKAEEDKSARASALGVYEKLLRLEPGNGEANYQTAMLLMWDGRYERSLIYLTKLSVEDRKRVGAEIVRCADEAVLHHDDEANKAAAAVIAASDFSEQDAMDLLPALQKARRADLIEQLFAASNQRASLSAAGLRVLGLAQEGGGKLESARKTLERAFSMGGTQVPLLVDLTRVAKAQKDYQGALGYLAHARELQPKDAGFAYEFGVIALRLGLLGESRKAMEEAVKIDPENAEFNFGMGIVSSFAQDSTQGLPYLEKYHALRPQDPNGLLALGTMYFRAKDYDSSSRWLKLAQSSDATAADAHYYLGRIARVTGRIDDAMHELEIANRLSPNRADILAELGQSYSANKQYPEAETDLEKALALDPDSYAANFGLLQLYARTGNPRREEQSKRFDEVKSRDEEHYQEMMRIITIHPE